MRCQFCGWDNSPDKEVCEKCNKPLSGHSSLTGSQASQSDTNNTEHPTERMSNASFNPKATVRESLSTGHSDISSKDECPECGYYLVDGECAACGYTVRGEKNRQSPMFPEDVKKTIRPIRKSEKKGEFRLIPISEETGLPEGDELKFEGTEITLNRDNTDPDNHTITSQEQANVSVENGVWTIEDRSEYKTTFVQASRKIELRPGDLILLGTQLYRFEL